MPPIVVETRIVAPIERCFDLARDLEAHVKTSSTWRSPLGFVGLVADKLFVERHLRAFLATKQSRLKQYAESIGVMNGPLR